MHTVSCSGEVSGASINAFLNMHADGSSIGELMGGQALLWDYTTVAELKQLCELANEQVKIVCCFNTKFSDTAFTLLQKTQEAFIGTGGIAQRFIDDMATTGLNFIRDATAYEAELSASDGMAFAAGLTYIWERIAELIREASALKLMYEGAQKKFAGILEWVSKDVKEYLDTQSMADCTTFMDESFESLHKFLDTFNVLPFILVVMGIAITHHSLLTSLWANVSHIPLKIFLPPLMSDAMEASGQMALLSYVAQQSVTIWERPGTVKTDAKDWYQGNGPNSWVWPWIRCGLGPTEAETGQGGANAIEEGSVGGPIIQDSSTAHVSTGPTRASTRRHSTSTSAIPGKEAQHS